MPSISSLSAANRLSSSSPSKSKAFTRKRSQMLGATTAALVGLSRGVEGFSSMGTTRLIPPREVTSMQSSRSTTSGTRQRSSRLGILLRSAVGADNADLVGDFDPFDLSMDLDEAFYLRYQSRRALRISLSSVIAKALASDASDWPFPLLGDATDAAALQGEEEEETQPGFGLWAARGMLLGLAMICGTAYGLTKYIETLSCDGGGGLVDLAACTEDVIPASEVAFARYIIAAMVSLPLLKDARPELLLGGMECGMWVSIGYMFQAQALATSVPAGHIAFISALMVVVVPLMSSVVFQKPVKPANAVSAAMALAGVGVLEGFVDMDALGESLSSLFATTTTEAATGSLVDEVSMAEAATASSTPEVAATLAKVSNDNLNAVMAATAASIVESEDSLSVLDAVLSTAQPSSSVLDQVIQFGENSGVGRGDLLALGQPLGFGISFLRIEQYLEKFQHVPNRVAIISGAQCMALAVASTVWLLRDFHGTIPDMTYMLEPHHLGTVMWTGILTTAVALYYEGVALKVASATDAALAFASEPVWATLFAAWLLNEKLGSNSYVGGAIILSACVLSALADSGDGEQEKTSTD